MIAIHLKLAAEEFALYLNSAPAVKAFHVAKETFDHNPEIMKLRQEFTTLAQEFLILLQPRLRRQAVSVVLVPRKNIMLAGKNILRSSLHR